MEIYRVIYLYIMKVLRSWNEADAVLFVRHPLHNCNTAPGHKNTQFSQGLFSWESHASSVASWVRSIVIVSDTSDTTAS